GAAAPGVPPGGARVHAARGHARPCDRAAGRARRHAGPRADPVNWADAVRLAARSVLRRPGRAALTVVAVALAAALFTAMLTMAETARSRVPDQLSKRGPRAGRQVAALAAQPRPG